MIRLSFCLSVLLVLSASLGAQEPFAGETLISPASSHDTHLIDMDGTLLRTWHGANRPASTAYMLGDHSILRPSEDPFGYFSTAGAAGGRIEWIGPDDNVVWDFLFSDETHQQHHDIQPLRNGNVLLAPSASGL